MDSQSDLTDGLLDQYEGGLGFVVSGEPPSPGTTWSHMLVSEGMGTNRLQWPDVTRAVCDTLRDSNDTYGTQKFAHPGKPAISSATSDIGQMLAVPFCTVLLMKGVLITINLRESRVAFLLTLYGVSEICQATVFFCICFIESFVTVFVAELSLAWTASFESSDMELFFLAYFLSAFSWTLLTCACVTFLWTQKAFGFFTALGSIVVTGMQVFVDYAGALPAGVLLLVETLFPFGNFMALTAHAADFEGLRWNNLYLSVNGISGSAHLVCTILNFVVNLILCVLFNLCIPRPFGVAPIGWRRLLHPSSWKLRPRRREADSFTGVTVESITKKYDTGTLAVSDVSIAVEPGECLLCVGANGAGKSTLLEMLCGCRQPTSGAITACNSNIFEDAQAYHRTLGVVFQDNALIPQYTAREHIELCARLQGHTEETIAAMLDLFISMFKMRDFIDNASENLSGGSKRKLCLAMALAKDPQVLVCDEPCAGIDVEARQIIWRAISAYPEMTSFINVHSIDEAESMTSRVLVMSQGRVKFMGSPAQMRDEFQCGYEVAILGEGPKNDIYPIVGRVNQAVPEVRISPDRPNVLLLPADLRVLAALEAIGDVQYLVHLDSLEITIRKMIEDDELQANAI
jgi:ABC-type multidrug transport system ATPase subunit